MSGSWRALDPAALPELLAERIDRVGGRVRVAVDGALAAAPADVAAALTEALRARGRPAVHVRAETFWRDASLRLEYGHTDWLAFRHDWLDAAALAREVLDPLGPSGSGAFLTSLRDPATNRVTREPPIHATANQVVIVSGELLLGRGLAFDLSIHLHLSPAALARRTPPDRAWTLPAFTDYDGDGADVLIKIDDPRHPALRTG